MFSTSLNSLKNPIFQKSIRPPVAYAFGKNFSSIEAANKDLKKIFEEKLAVQNEKIDHLEKKLNNEEKERSNDYKKYAGTAVAAVTTAAFGGLYLSKRIDDTNQRITDLKTDLKDAKTELKEYMKSSVDSSKNEILAEIRKSK